MGTQSAAPALYPNLKYDPATSFEQIGICNFTPQAIVAKKDTAAERPQGVPRVPQGQLHQAQLWPRRRRLDPPRVGHALQCAVRLQAGARRLPRHQSRAQRPGRRPDRLHGRPVAQRHPADQGRHHQGLRHRCAGAARKPARRADHQGAGRRFHLQRLERHGRAQGHAEGDRRQARRRARQGAGRSDDHQALRRARQHGPARRRSRPGRPAEAGRERDGAHHAGAQGSGRRPPSERRGARAGGGSACG